MMKFFLGLIIGVGFGLVLAKSELLENEETDPKVVVTEGVYLAYPLKLSTSVDFRDDGTMFMAVQLSGEWFNWIENNTQVFATGTSDEYKDKTLVFEKKNDDLFLENIRFSKQN